jgi:DNA polymerase-1
MDKSELCVLLDSDGFIYSQGFAADKQAIEAYGLDGYLQEDYLHWAQGNINRAMEKVFEVFKDAEWHRVYISGKGNYRDTIATTIPRVHEGWKYKGNRDPLHKPKYFAEIKQYLIDKWGAVPVDGIETDDACCIEQFARPDRSTCIVSVDKDLRS